MRVAEDVPQRVREAVPGAVGQEQRSVVENAHEPGRVATRAHVTRAVGRGGRKEDERRQVDEATGQLVEPVVHLRADEVRGVAEERAELCLFVDGRHQTALTELISFTIESFALPKSIVVRGSRNSSLSMPANPGAIERFITITLVALSTSRIGMP